MKDSLSTPVIIGVLVGLLILAGGTLYFVVFGLIPGGWVARVIIAAVTLAVLGALGYVVWERFQEIQQEDPDDYRKY